MFEKRPLPMPRTFNRSRVRTASARSPEKPRRARAPASYARTLKTFSPFSSSIAAISSRVRATSLRSIRRFYGGNGCCRADRQRRICMSVAKIIELVASSDKSWEDAVRNAVAEAAKTVRGIRGVDVQDWTARVEGNRIVEYKANVKVAFGIEGE